MTETTYRIDPTIMQDGRVNPTVHVEVRVGGTLTHRYAVEAPAFDVSHMNAPDVPSGTRATLQDQIIAIAGQRGIWSRK